ncbi:unnamed protein product [Phaeothamnion confervicola]
MVVHVLRNEIVVHKTRVDGSEVRIAEVLLADETGAVLLRGRNEQIDVLRPGSVVVVRNAAVEMFKSYIRLVVTKWGKISPHPDGVESTGPAPPAANVDNNISNVEYQLVPAQSGSGAPTDRNVHEEDDGGDGMDDDGATEAAAPAEP